MTDCILAYSISVEGESEDNRRTFNVRCKSGKHHWVVGPDEPLYDQCEQQLEKDPSFHTLTIPAHLCVECVYGNNHPSQHNR